MHCKLPGVNPIMADLKVAAAAGELANSILRFLERYVGNQTVAEDLLH